MSNDWCVGTDDGVRLLVQITPNAKRSEVIGVLDDMLKIRLHAQPIEGKANEALIRFVADSLGIPKSTVHLVRGHTAKRKTLTVSAAGMTVEAVKLALVVAPGSR
jgi:hypothetical protein